MATSKSLELDPYSFPISLPHISGVGNRIYFGSKYMGDLQPAESQFLTACDGGRTLADIVQSTSITAGSVARLARWLIWWDEKVNRSRPAPEVQRLVLSARPEDAWVGMGGRLLLEAPDQSTLVFSCFGMLANTQYSEAFRTPSEVSIICRDEIALAARLAHAGQVVWEIPEQAIRQLAGESGGWDKKTVTATLQGVVLETLAKYRPAEVFIPAGTRIHSDGHLLFEILLSLMVEGHLKADLHVYEDAPGSNGHRPVDEFLSRFEFSYLEASEYFVNITGTAQRKESLMQVFRCRLSHRETDAWERSVKRNALLAGEPEDQLVERFWKVTVAGLK